MTPESLDPELVGYVAATLTTLSFVPQALLTLRSGNAGGVSLRMYALFTTGVALWLLYGVLTGAWPVIPANAVTLGLASLILVATWRGRRARAPGCAPRGRRPRAVCRAGRRPARPDASA